MLWLNKSWILLPKFDTKKAFTLAASVTGVFVDKPRIFGTATDADIIKTFDKRNILTMDNGSIGGMNGLVIGIAKLRGMKGTCLLGETSGYVVCQSFQSHIFGKFAFDSWNNYRYD